MPRFSVQAANAFLDKFLESTRGDGIVRGLLTQRQLESSQLEDELARQREQRLANPAFEPKYIDEGRLMTTPGGAVTQTPGWEPAPKDAKPFAPKYIGGGRLRTTPSGEVEPTPGWTAPPRAPRAGAGAGAPAAGKILGMPTAQAVDLWYNLPKPQYNESTWRADAAAAKKQGLTIKREEWEATQEPIAWGFDRQEDEYLYNALSVELSKAGLQPQFNGPYKSRWEGEELIWTPERGLEKPNAAR